MIIATYDTQNSICHNLLREATLAIGEKWGVSVFDFENLPYWWGKSQNNLTVFENPNDPDGYWQSENGTDFDGNVEGFNRARLSYDGTHPSNFGYKILSDPFGLKMLNP